MSSEDAWSLEKIAIDKFEGGSYEESLNFFEKASSLNASDPRIYFNHALVLSKLGDTSSALEILKKGLELDDKDRNAVKLLSILVDFYCKEGRGKDYLDKFIWVRKYLKIRDFFLNYSGFSDLERQYLNFFNQPNLDFYAPLVDIIREGKPKNKIFYLNTANHYMYYVSNEVNWIYEYLVLVNLEKMNMEDLLDFLSRNYNELPDNEKGKALIWCFSKGKKLYEDADYEESALLFKSLVDIEPENLTVLFHAGKAFRDSGELHLIEESTVYFKQIIELHYENIMAWYDLSLCYAMLGDFGRELFCLRKAREFGSTMVDAGRIEYLEEIGFSTDPFE
ncbi:MAG: tetratricopeptide repeat protein [Candidatus Hodarchaeota archaeon]